MPKIKEKGLNISEKELLYYEKESLKSLTEKDLVNINGGLSLNSVFLGGGLLSMIFLGVGSINSQTASATVTGEQIKTSIQEMIETSNISEENLSTNDSLEIHEEIEENTEEDAEENVQREEVDNTENETIPGVTLEAAQQATQNQIEDNKRSTQAEQKTDNQYIMEALNLADPYILQVSGTVERFRFLDGNKTVVNFGDIGGDGVPMWDFKKDSGEGSANLMTSLFPSSAGVLSDGGGYGGMNPLSAINPTPELIAHILNFLHDYRNDTKENQNEKRGSIDEILTSLNEKNLKNIEKRKEKFNDFNNPNNITTSENLTEDCLTKKGVIKALRAIDTEISRKYKGNLDLEKAKELWEKYKEAVENPFLNIEQQFEKYKLTQTSKALDDASKAKYYKTIGYILKNVMYLIENQEEDKSDVERILPKYTPERMIMAYFIHHFNDEQVEPFYDKVKKIIKTAKNQDLQSVTENLRNKLELLKQITLKVDSPYRAQLTVMQPQGHTDIDFIKEDPIAQLLSKDLKVEVEASKMCQFNKLFGGPEILERDTQYIKNVIALKFLRDLQGEENNFYRIREKLSKELLKSNIKAIINVGKNIKEEQSVSFFIFNNFISKILRKRLPMVQFRKEDIIDFFKSNSRYLENINGIDYAYYYKTDGSITICPIITQRENKLTIPSEIKINNENKKVSGVWGISYLAPDEFDAIDIVFSENIETLEIYNKTFSAMKIKNIVFPSHLKSLKIARSGISISSIETLDLSSCADLESLDIGEHAFHSCKQLKEVKLPQNLKSLKIGGWAFYGTSIETFDLSTCTNLENLYIEERAFHSCKQLKGVKLPPNLKSLKIGTKAFCETSIETFDLSMCENLERLDIEDSAFESCRELKVLFPKSLKSLKIGKTGESAFVRNSVETLDLSNCENLEHLDIEDNAFKLCQQLKGVKLPQSLKSLKIDRQAFYGTSIETLDLSMCENLENLAIEDNAFRSCKQLKGVKLPQSLKSLKIGKTGEAAFVRNSVETLDLSDCTNLESLDIEDYGFKSCKQLKEVIFPESLKSLKIGKFAFYRTSIETFDLSNCTDLENLDIEYGGFESVQQLKVIFSKSLKSLKIREKAFSRSSIETFDLSKCENLESLDIEDDAFKSCSQLKVVLFPKNLKSLKMGISVFARSSIKTFDLSNCVSLESLDIGYSAFLSCKQLKGLKLSQSLKSLKIGTEAFSRSSIETFDLSNCTDLESLDIKYGAFSSCRELKRVLLPKSLTSLKIGKEAFWCAVIETLDLSKCTNLESLDIGVAAFRSCRQLKTVLFPSSLTSLKIGKEAFSESAIETLDLSNCKNLESLYIEDIAFYSCKQLKEVLLPKSLKSLKIGKSAFYGTSIETLDLSNCTNLETLDIGDNAFKSCKQLKKVIFPESLSSLEIGEDVFYGDINMKTINLSNLLNLKNVKISIYNFPNVWLGSRLFARKLKSFCFDILHSLKQFLNFLLISLRRFF